MGYKVLFWIREQPIRQHIAEHGETPELAEELGRAVRSLPCDNYADWDELFPDCDASPPVLGRRDLVNRVWGFHTYAYGLMAWTGEDLVLLNLADPAMFESLLRLEEKFGTSHVVEPVSPATLLQLTYEEGERTASFDGPLLDGPVVASIWTADERLVNRSGIPDRSRDADRLVGELVFEQLRVNVWPNREYRSDLQHPVVRYFSITQHAFAAFAWTGRPTTLSGIPAHELPQIRESLETGWNWLGIRRPWRRTASGA